MKPNGQKLGGKGVKDKEDSDTGYLGAFPDVMRVQLLPS